MNLTSKDKSGIAILSVVFILAIAIFTAPLLIDKPKFDEVTLCPLEQQYDQSIFIVDTTDQLDAREQRNLMGELTNVRDSLQQFERLSIYLISEEIGGLSEPVFDKCAPPTGEDANEWVEAPLLIKREYDREFGDRLDEIMSSLPKGESANQSPIIESLADIANRIRRESSEWADLRVYVFSDMMQHTGDWSHYNGKQALDFEAFRESRFGSSMMMDFGGADIKVFYIMRSSNKNPKELREFWSKLLSSANASWTWVPIS